MDIVLSVPTGGGSIFPNPGKYPLSISSVNVSGIPIAEGWDLLLLLLHYRSYNRRSLRVCLLGLIYGIITPSSFCNYFFTR